MNTEKNQEQIDMIIRQTDYNQETAEQKLIEFNNDMMTVIRDYMNPSGDIKVNTNTEKKVSKNQQIYKEIRGMMDNASRVYEDKKAKQKMEEEQINASRQPSDSLNVIQEEVEAEAEVEVEVEAEAKAEAEATDKN